MLSIPSLDIKIIDKKGNFFCPKCKTFISPEDKTEEVYSIIETRIVHNNLKEITLACNCGAIISMPLE